MEGIDDSPATELNGRESLIMSSNLILDGVGGVFLSLTSVGMHWQVIESICNEELSCLGIQLVSKRETDVEFSNIYAAELINWGPVHVSVLADAKEFLLGHSSGMYRFSVHVVQRSNSQPSIWIPSVFTFGSEDLQVCQMWVNQINNSLNREMGRPKNLLVFVHPKSGKGNGCKHWELVAPIFSHARIQTKVIVTERAGEAYDMMLSITNKELNSYDGVVAVGGDGFFNEILNGLLASRLKVPLPPAPSDIHPATEKGISLMVNQSREQTVEEPSDHAEDSSPLLLGPCITESTTTAGNEDGRGCNSAEGSAFILPNEWFRLGLIPAGSTDAIVICTTGARDPMTSALHIVLGKRVQLDIAQIVRWKMMSTSKTVPFVRYAASFCGYGFYGDVITESEKYRWMGPKRYDYAGTLVFLNHRSYEAEIRYLESTTDNKSSSDTVSDNRNRTIWGKWKPSEKAICCVNCKVCNTKPNCTLQIPTKVSLQDDDMDETRWVKTRGRYLSIGGAIISCRNERAPNGLVADAHLSDGFLHLIMIKDCPHALYLWHLTQLARNGGSPLDFEFVEHHKTKAFTFTSIGKESVWNLDGELFQAHQLSAQVLRGLVSLFATGPDT
ncbi:ceramide kinase-like isoform X2 [Impatiens glandulifera]|uniref:ceramide kinase-like isoform X2 n=1 Tax=Impatiens glandulifera TaxID=253017 RepID=UPI001FB161E6|nr:ceramide kinase-like isoform X2 [Impatiens glandulifera]